MNQIKITAKEKYQVAIREIRSMQKQLIDVDDVLRKKDKEADSMVNGILELQDDLQKSFKIIDLSQEEIETLKRQIKTRDDLLQMVPILQDIDVKELLIQKFPESVEDNRSVEEKYSALKTLFNELSYVLSIQQDRFTAEVESSRRVLAELDHIKGEYNGVSLGFNDELKLRTALEKENAELRQKLEDCRRDKQL